MPANFSEWRESLDIFEKYMGENADPCCHSELDSLRGGPEPDSVNDADRIRLEELGWHECETGCFKTSMKKSDYLF